ncbi:MAG: amidohydrolase family protein [Myxococcaceae bacterium]|nr:amidohydrolase family protein [Myxococcaceae bacterium]
MGTILKGATLVEFEPAAVEVGDLRIEGSKIVERGPSIQPREGDEVIPLDGKVVIPGLVSADHHLFGTLARGMPEGAPSQDFEEQQRRSWWRLEDALDLDASQAAATAGALEALMCGTTTLFDRHASPRAIHGSLVRVARGINEVGLRAVLSYEVSDRHGAVGREEGLEETVSFVKKARGRFRGMVGAHACFTLSHDALSGLKAAVDETGAGLHITLAEDPADERLSFQRYGEVPVARLVGQQLLTPNTLVSHVVHLSWPELSQVISAGAWIVHSPRTNMERQVGYAPAGKFGSRATFGTSAGTADVFTEALLAHHRARDAGQPIPVLKYLANGHRIASQVFGETIGPLCEGAIADLVVLDYRPPTPITPENLASHVVGGFGPRCVESVMIDGVWRLWARRPLSVTPETVFANAREAAAAVWARMEAANAQATG